jgi:hypothetical protein
MSWFRRRINRWRNFMSDADYAGSQGGGRSGGGAPSEGENSTTYRESAITEVRTRGSVGPGG